MGQGHIAVGGDVGGWLRSRRYFLRRALKFPSTHHFRGDLYHLVRRKQGLAVAPPTDDMCRLMEHCPIIRIYAKHLECGPASAQILVLLSRRAATSLFVKRLHGVILKV